MIRMVQSGHEMLATAVFGLIGIPLALSLSSAGLVGATYRGTVLVEGPDKPGHDGSGVVVSFRVTVRVL
jgi:hypothetical protein